MNWPADVPDMPIDKPKEIARLEKMPRDELNSLPPWEIDNMITLAGASLAEAYSKQVKGDYQGCIDVVSTALEQTGSGIGGHFGAEMASRSTHVAHSACRIFYPE